MEIIYVSSLCSQRQFSDLFRLARIKPAQQAQKYHRLMVEGFIENTVEHVHVVSARPINRTISGKIYYKGQCETVGEVTYHYLPFLNYPILRAVLLLVYGAVTVFFLCKKCKKERVVICDILNVSISGAALIAAKLARIPTVGIVTDVPAFLEQMSVRSKSLMSKIVVIVNSFLMHQFNSYVFLTEYMNNLVNTQHKPYVVIEGQVDHQMMKRESSLSIKNEKKICMYTGAIHEIYGISMLVEAFIAANIEDAELHIYGDGDFVQKLKEICDRQMNIKYFGVVPNEVIVEEQLKATLLINPRPTGQEYTKYSFPSKNMEYMASGTAVLTTALPGMPEEYEKYVILISEESIEGLTKKLTEVLMMDKADLHAMGKTARDFVLEKKNNRVQSEKILKMVSGNFLK